MPLAYEDAVVVQVMTVPALDFSGTNRELIDVNQRGGMRRPVRAHDLAQRAPIVLMGGGGLDHDTFDERRHASAVRGNGLPVLNGVRNRRMGWFRNGRIG